MNNDYNNNSNNGGRGGNNPYSNDDVKYTQSSENIYSHSSDDGSYRDSTQAGSSQEFFDADGNYRRKYSSYDQPSGSYEQGGYSSTQYIDNSGKNQYHNQAAQNTARQNGYYTTPQSYYTPTDGQKADNKKRKKKKSGKGAMAAVMIISVMCSGVLGFGGGMLATRLGGSSSGDVKIQKVVETVSTSSGEDSGSMTTEAIVEKTADSVVEIMTESVATGSYMQNYITEGAGSGVIISENGYIVTNNHVIDGARTIKVTTRDGKSYDAKLVGTAAPTLDIALLKVDATGFTAATMGNSEEIKVGEKVVAIGNPLGQLGGTVTEGIVSALNRDISIDGTTMNLMQTNAEINPGNSGGGIFDDHGNLIGIVVAKSTGSEVEGLGFAIPVNDVSDVVEDLTKFGYVTGVIDTGLSLLDISNNQTAMMYGVSETGVYIQNITAGSAAESAGFMRGDRIVSVDGTEVSTSAEFDSVIKKRSVGDEVTIRVSRNGKTTDLKLTLEEDKPKSAQTSNGFNDENVNGGSNGGSNGSFEDFFDEFFN